VFSFWKPRIGFTLSLTVPFSLSMFWLFSLLLGVLGWIHPIIFGICIGYCFMGGLLSYNNYWDLIQDGLDKKGGK